MRLTKAKNDEIDKLLSALPLMEHRLRRAGLLETAVQMNKAVQRIGFEVARLRGKDAWDRTRPKSRNVERTDK